MRETRTVVITGASRGLGLASASLLYARGWRVIAAMRSVESGLGNLRSATGASADDPRLIGVSMDLDDSASIHAAVNAILSITQAPDVIILNAGIAAAGSVEDTPVAAWQKLFSTNLFGPVEFIKALLPSLRTARRGRIIAVSSMAGIRGMPISSIYSASKSAMERWAESLAAEIAPFGLGVTVLVTGTFDTEIITGRTPDYGIHDGPYSAHYIAMRRATDPIIAKAASPHYFARELAKTIEDTAPFVRKTVGLDALGMSIIARVLPAKWFHKFLCKVLGLPGQSGTFSGT